VPLHSVLAWFKVWLWDWQVQGFIRWQDFSILSWNLGSQHTHFSLRILGEGNRYQVDGSSRRPELSLFSSNTTRKPSKRWPQPRTFRSKPRDTGPYWSNFPYFQVWHFLDHSLPVPLCLILWKCLWSEKNKEAYLKVLWNWGMTMLTFWLHLFHFRAI